MPKIIFFVLQGNIIARLKKLTFMDIKDLKNALYEGIVIFEFVKKNGEHRKARGTTCPDIVPTDDKPKGKRHRCSKRSTTAKP